MQENTQREPYQYRAISPRATALLSHLSESNSNARQNPLISPDSLLSTPSTVKNGINRAKINYPQLITSLFAALLVVTFLIKYQPSGTFVKILDNRMLLPVRDEKFTGALQQPLVLITSQENGSNKLSTKIPNLVVTLFNRLELVSLYNFRHRLRSLVDMGSASTELAEKFREISGNDSFFVRTVVPPVTHAIAAVHQNTLTPIKRQWRLNIDTDPTTHNRDSADPLPYHTAVLDNGLDLSLLNQHLVPLWRANLAALIPDLSCEKYSGWNVLVTPSAPDANGESGFVTASFICHNKRVKDSVFVNFGAVSGEMLSYSIAKVPDLTSRTPFPLKIRGDNVGSPLANYLKSPYFDDSEVGHEVKYYLRPAKLTGHQASQKMHPSWTLPDSGVFFAPNFITFFRMNTDIVDTYVKHPAVAFGPASEDGCYLIYYVSLKGNLKTVHYCEATDIAHVDSSYSVKKSNLGYKSIKDLSDDYLDDVNPVATQPILLHNKGRYEPIYYNSGVLTKIAPNKQGWSIKLEEVKPLMRYCNTPGISVHSLSQNSPAIVVVSCHDDIIFIDSQSGKALIADNLPILQVKLSAAEARTSSEEFLMNNLDTKNVFHGPILSLNPEEEQTLFVRRGNLMHAYIYLKPSFRLINRIGEYLVCIIIVTSVSYFAMHLVRNLESKDN